jgi:serine phosphatase RsbU (regulator of sigma subunit)
LQRAFFIFFVIFCAINIGYGLGIDSLQQVLNATNSRKRKVDILNRFNASYKVKDNEFTFSRFRQAIQLANEIRYRDGLAMAYENLASYYFINNAADSAIYQYNKALLIYQERTNDQKTAITLFNIGNVYYASSKYAEAFEYADKSLELFQIIGDIQNIASTHTLICEILSSSGFDADAIEHCLTALNLFTELESLEGQSNVQNSIGNIYLKLGQIDKSYTFFDQAYYLSELDDNSSLLSTSLRNLGNYYLRSGNYENALESFNKSLEIELKKQDIDKIGYLYLDLGMTNSKLTDFELSLENLQKALLYADSSYNLELKARVYSELGSFYSETEKYDIAIVFLKQSLFVAQQINADPVLQECYKNLSSFYDRVNDAENALKYYKLYVSHKDTLSSHQSAIQIAEAEALYALDKKDKQIELLRNENRLREMEAGEKRMINIWLISVLTFVFILTLILFRQYRIQNKVNQALNEQKNAINQQKIEIELQKESIEKANIILAEKNKQITDSLEYAKRIQLSLLPDGELLKQKFRETFIWYLPRDIVGGDFYWYAEFKDTVCLVVLDCSGHGVPGAFMTVLVNTLLNKGVMEIKSFESPIDVLNYLDENVKKELNQQGIKLSAFEGIDLAACIFDTKTLQLKYSGAKLPLYYYSNGDLNYFKGNRFSVGGGNISSKKFNMTSIQLKVNDIIYLATDGFQDQFGGDKGKKYMKLHFKNLLKLIAKLPLEQQHQRLSSVFQEWKNFNLQTDDILIMGIKV